jgi:hypothetical protein
MIKKHETYTLDWYVKWVASLFLITGMILRTTQQYMFADITLSMIGAAGWMWVGIMWKDRSLTLLNVTATAILLYGFILGLTN